MDRGTATTKHRVIIQLTQDVTDEHVATLERTAGEFSVLGRLSLIDGVSASVNRPPLACSVSGQVVTCPLGSLPGRDSVRVVLVANVTSAVYTSNGAYVTELQDDANPANNSAAITHS
jgi:hypothetical protein